MVNCPTCGSQFSSLGGHFQWHPEHRPELSESQLGAVEYLILRGANIRENTSHPYLEVYGTDLDLLRDVGGELGWLGGEPKLHEPAEKVADDFTDRFGSEITEDDCSDVWRLTTVPHPQLDYEEASDVETLKPPTRRFLLKYHSRFVGDVLGSLHIDVGGMNVDSSHIRDLLRKAGYSAYVGGGGKEHESLTHRFANDSDVVVVPHYDAIGLLEESGLSLSNIPVTVQGHSSDQ